MMKGLQAMLKTERWKRNDGADFVFFDPHPGFTDGKSDKDFKQLMCHTSKNSMHIVVERGQINICPVSPRCCLLYTRLHILLPTYNSWQCDEQMAALAFAVLYPARSELKENSNA